MKESSWIKARHCPVCGNILNTHFTLDLQLHWVCVNCLHKDVDATNIASAQETAPTPAQVVEIVREQRRVELSINGRGTHSDQYSSGYGTGFHDALDRVVKATTAPPPEQEIIKQVREVDPYPKPEQPKPDCAKCRYRNRRFDEQPCSSCVGSIPTQNKFET